MKKKSIYLDTSVISALIDSRTPERQNLTKVFWDQAIYNYYIYISEIVVDELNDVSDKSLRKELLDTVASFKVLNVSQEIMPGRNFQPWRASSSSLKGSYPPEIFNPPSRVKKQV